MGVEIERKFLVAGDSWRQQAGAGVSCRQGYLVAGQGITVRVRILGEEAFLTIKGPTVGISRCEFEYAIPPGDAAELLALCENRVEKTRYFIPCGGLVWDLDVFGGANEGLVMAEVELESEGQPFELPEWAGREVSGDPRYYNSHLARNPFTRW